MTHRTWRRDGENEQRYESRIGAPNSIARYCANTQWGENEYAVMEYDEHYQPVCRAAGSKAHCAGYMKEGRYLVHVANY